MRSEFSLSMYYAARPECGTLPGPWIRQSNPPGVLAVWPSAPDPRGLRGTRRAQSGDHSATSPELPTLGPVYPSPGTLGLLGISAPPFVSSQPESPQGTHTCTLSQPRTVPQEAAPPSRVHPPGEPLASRGEVPSLDHAAALRSRSASNPWGLPPPAPRSPSLSQAPDALGPTALATLSLHT